VVHVVAVTQPLMDEQALQIDGNVAGGVRQ
jgi:hypothetical protein